MPLLHIYCSDNKGPAHESRSRAETEANARLMAASPDMYAALLNVRAIISEGAATGFNWKDGDWAERLFASQQVTSAALKKSGA
jgi:hypothetical protein